MPRKRKFSPLHNGNDGCWVWGKKGHFKDECPYLRCRFCKMLNHVITECPTLPTKLRVNLNETRRSMLRTNKATMGDERSLMVQPRPKVIKHTQPTQREVAVMQSHANPRGEVAAEHNCATPCVFIPMSDQTVQ